mmetsp:Transcript_1504/g.2296  ORF Transcript_1504/g.2296 Transcript_1504/m.2296 type:complete len:127 (+) Transcript_1504:220-600(+)
MFRALLIILLAFAHVKSNSAAIVSGSAPACWIESAEGNLFSQFACDCDERGVQITLRPIKNLCWYWEVDIIDWGYEISVNTSNLPTQFPSFTYWYSSGGYWENFDLVLWGLVPNTLYDWKVHITVT